MAASIAWGGLAAGVAAQPAAKASPGAPASTAQAVELAERGRCAEALPALRRNTPRLTDKKLRYRAGMAAARCAMGLNDAPAALEALALLRREFPRDAEVLYVSARFFSMLANRAAQELAEGFPDSQQVAKLNAEALESRQQWDQAIAAYRDLLARHPGLPDIHYRIAGILLDRSSTPEAAAEAKKELEEELRVAPRSAPAVFGLGEIARRSADWDTAIGHFSRAVELDPGFLEAYLALGMALGSAGKHAEAIAPLERYTKMVPADPAGHYQLALAYSRTGNKTAAERQLQLHAEALEKARSRRPPTAPVRQ